MPFEAEQHAVPPGRLCCFPRVSKSRTLKIPSIPADTVEIVENTVISIFTYIGVVFANELRLVTTAGIITVKRDRYINKFLYKRAFDE